jgi:DHA1 family multidrug/chloramphenicol efflux transport protein-like MFS transporter
MAELADAVSRPGLAAAVAWLGLYVCMPETIGVMRNDGQQQAPVAFNARQVGHRYLTLLGNRHFLYASLALGLMSLP